MWKHGCSWHDALGRDARAAQLRKHATPEGATVVVVPLKYRVLQLNAEAEESRRLEERNQQLRAEKERLMYDLQRRGNPLDDVDARSAIRRGLLAGPCHSSHTSGAGCPGPSVSLPASLPPGPPSSNSSGPVVAPIGSTLSSSWVEADRPESATTAESIYDEELERVLAKVTESERTAAPGTVTYT